LIRLDKKLEGSAKSTKKLTEKLSKNLDKIKKFPKKIPAGEDNRTDILHEARFLGGHTPVDTQKSGFKPENRLVSPAWIRFRAMTPNASA
jgi:hypothetical protein